VTTALWLGLLLGVRHALDPDRHALLARHIAALDGPLACVRLLDEIEGRVDGPAPVGAARRGRGLARLAGRRVYRGIGKRTPIKKPNPFYIRHKFPGIDAAEVDARIGRLGAALGRFEGLAAEEILPDIFRIVRRKARAQAAE